MRPGKWTGASWASLPSRARRRATSPRWSPWRARCLRPRPRRRRSSRRRGRSRCGRARRATYGRKNNRRRRPRVSRGRRRSTRLFLSADAQLRRDLAQGGYTPHGTAEGAYDAYDAAPQAPPRERPAVLLRRRSASPAGGVEAPRLSEFAKTMPPGDTAVVIDVPHHLQNKAGEAGAHYDRLCREWWVPKGTNMQVFASALKHDAAAGGSDACAAGGGQNRPPQRTAKRAAAPKAEADSLSCTHPYYHAPRTPRSPSVLSMAQTSHARHMTCMRRACPSCAASGPARCARPVKTRGDAVHPPARHSLRRRSERLHVCVLEQKSVP